MKNLNERNARLLELFRSGYTYADLIEETGLSKAAIGRALKKAREAESGYKQDESQPAKTATKLSGFDLLNKKITKQKPQISPLRLKIRSLPANRGFSFEDLAEEWGDTPEKIEEQARKMGCRLAVEIQPDKWVYLAMEPETAKRYKL